VWVYRGGNEHTLGVQASVLGIELFELSGHLWVSSTQGCEVDYLAGFPAGQVVAKELHREA
jgi:hypothetical protein